MTTLFCIYNLLIFSDWVSTVSATATYNAGWMQCVIILLVILWGIYGLIREIVETIKLKWRQYRYRKMEKLLLQHRPDSSLSKADPDDEEAD